jgi:hypothetical protein
VGTEFDHEQSRLGDESKNHTTMADAQRAKTMDATQAKSWVDNAAKSYAYGGAPQTDYYKSGTQAVKKAQSAQWEAPTSYNFNLSQNANKYAEGLQQPQFRGFMDQVYGEKTGQRLGGGMLELQHQLDTSDPSVEQARQNLAQRYQTLTGNVNQTVDQTNKKITEAKNIFDSNKAGVNSYLNSQSQQDQDAVDARVGDLRKVQDYYTNTVNDQTKGNDQYDRTGFAYSGQNADRQNATGVDTQRNRFNTIMDILGSENMIGKSNPYQLGNIRYDIHGKPYTGETGAGFTMTMPDGTYNVAGDPWASKFESEIKNATGVDYFPQNSERPAPIGNYLPEMFPGLFDSLNPYQPEPSAPAPAPPAPTAGNTTSTPSEPRAADDRAGFDIRTTAPAEEPSGSTGVMAPVTPTAEPLPPAPIAAPAAPTSGRTLDRVYQYDQAAPTQTAPTVDPVAQRSTLQTAVTSAQTQYDAATKAYISARRAGERAAAEKAMREAQLALMSAQNQLTALGPEPTQFNSVMGALA